MCFVSWVDWLFSTCTYSACIVSCWGWIWGTGSHGRGGEEAVVGLTCISLVVVRLLCCQPVHLFLSVLWNHSWYLIGRTSSLFSTLASFMAVWLEGRPASSVLWQHSWLCDGKDVQPLQYFDIIHGCVIGRTSSLFSTLTSFTAVVIARTSSLLSTLTTFTAVWLEGHSACSVLWQHSWLCGGKDVQPVQYFDIIHGCVMGRTSSLFSTLTAFMAVWLEGRPACKKVCVGYPFFFKTGGGGKSRVVWVTDVHVDHGH